MKRLKKKTKDRLEVRTSLFRCWFFPIPDCSSFRCRFAKKTTCGKKNMMLVKNSSGQALKGERLESKETEILFV